MDKQQKLWKKLRTAGFFFIPLIASPGIGAGSGISSGLIDQHLLSDFINIQTGTSSDETVIWHEIGHLGGLKHPPGTIGWGEPPDSNWPRASDYSNGRIGVWGWDSRASSQYPNGRLINPMTGDLMGGRNPRWISDYDVAVWFQNMKMAPSPVIQSQTTVRIKEQLKSKFIFEGTDLAYFDKRLSILNGVVKSNSDVGYWLNSSTSSVGDTLGLRNPNGRIEVINRQGAVLSFPCMIESLSEDTRLKCDFIADIPVRTGFTKYKVYFNKDDPSPVAVGTVPTPPSDPVVKMNIIDDKRFEIEVDRTQDDLTDVFYTLDAGATWAELSTMHDGKDTTDFDTSMKGKDLRVLAVCYHGSKRVAYLYLAQQGIVKKVEGF